MNNTPEVDALKKALDSHIEALNELARLKKMSDRRSFIAIIVIIPTAIIALTIISLYNKEKNIRPKFSSAEELINSGEYGEAIKVLENLIVKNKNDYIAMQEIARCYVKVGNYMKAKEYWDMAKSTFPNKCNEEGSSAVDKILLNKK